MSDTDNPSPGKQELLLQKMRAQSAERYDKAWQQRMALVDPYPDATHEARVRLGVQRWLRAMEAYTNINKRLDALEASPRDPNPEPPQKSGGFCALLRKKDKDAPSPKPRDR